MGGRGAIAVAVGLVLLAAAPVWAGTKTDPEVQDDADVDGFDAVDLTAGWIQHQGRDLHVAVHVVDLGDGPDPLTTQTYRFSFVVDATEYHLEAKIERTATGPSEDYHLLDAQGDRLYTLSGAYDTDRDEIRWTVPRRFVGDPGPGDPIEQTRAEASLEAGGDSAARDVAPDQGFGAAYTFPSDGDAAGSDTPQGTTTTQAPTNGGTLAGIGILVVGAVAAVGYLGYRTQRTRIEVGSPDPDQATHPGEGQNFPILLKNRASRPIHVDLEADDVPEGWVAFLPLPNVDLEAGETRELWVTVKPPADASLGDDTTVRVVARTKDDRADVAEVELTARVEEKPPQTTV